MGEFILLFVGIFVGLMVSFSRVGEKDLIAMNERCSANGGFERAVINMGIDVYCKDGAKFRLKD